MTAEPSVDTQESDSGILRLRPEHPSEDFARGIAYETIRRNIFGDHKGFTIGRYRVDKLIGRGGMGEVYAAHDPELDRPVAIKRVGGSAGPLNDDRLRSALMRDARSAARVQHPHVVEIYDCGVQSDELYVVMELVEGPTLEQWLEQRSRSWREIVEVFIAAGQGLACAHAHDVVHRDFKPANVLIGEDGRPRVADFGLAQIIDDLRRSQSERVAGDSVEPKEIAGTPQYMAPEQYLCTEVGPPADQFSFCNALYRALFEEAPFEGDTIPALSANVITGRIRLPSTRNRVPRALVRAVMRGMVADPAKRHRSMDVLIAILCSILARRRRVLGGMLSGVLVLGSAFAGRSFWPEPTPPSPCAFAAEPWTSQQRGQIEQSLRQRVSFGDPTVNTIMEALERHARRWTEARQDACAATQVRGEQSDELMDLRIECFDRQRASFSSTFERLAAADGPAAVRVLKLIEELPPSSDCGAELVRERAAKSRRYSLDLDSSRQSRAALHDLAARLGAARAEAAAARYARAYQEAAVVASEAEALGARDLLADALLLKGTNGLMIPRTEDDQRVAWQALGQARLAAIESGSTRLVTESFLAMARLSSGRLSPIERADQLDIAWAHASTLPDAGILSARIELARGRLALEQGRASEAIDHLERVQQLAPDGPLALLALSDIAAAHLSRSELHEAKELWQSLHQQLARLSPSDPRLASTLHNLAIVALRETEYDDALSLARRAEHIYETNPASDRRYLLRVRIRIGRTLRRMKEPLEAQRVLREVIGALEEMGVAGREVLLEALDEMVEIEIDRGEHSAAVQTARRWLDVALAGYRRDDPNVARARMMLAKAALGARQLQLARAQIAQAHEHRHGMPMLLQAETSYYYAQITDELGDRGSARRFYVETITTLEQERNTGFWQEIVRGWAQQRGY